MSNDKIKKETLNESAKRHPNGSGTLEYVYKRSALESPSDHSEKRYSPQQASSVLKTSNSPRPPKKDDE